jgi:hypothetical protein
MKWPCPSRAWCSSTVNGEKHEPIELVTADIEDQHQGGVMQALGERKGELVNMEPDGRGRVRLEYRIPARGLIGFTNEFLNLTRGSGLISNIFDSYEAHKGEIGSRKNGVLISMDDGEIFTYALGKLDDRGRMFVRANDPVYEGMIVGIHSRDNDLVVNATRTKQLTNFRVSGKEDAIKITPPIDLTLEYGVEFIEDDELVEITPKSCRLRKRHLKEHERKRAPPPITSTLSMNFIAPMRRVCFARDCQVFTACTSASISAWASFTMRARSAAMAKAGSAATCPRRASKLCASSSSSFTSQASVAGRAGGTVPTMGVSCSAVSRRSVSMSPLPCSAWSASCVMPWSASSIRSSASMALSDASSVWGLAGSAA